VLSLEREQRLSALRRGVLPIVGLRFSVGPLARAVSQLLAGGS